MTIKEVYKEAIEARKELGLVGGDITFLMNMVMLNKIYNKLCEDRVNAVRDETTVTPKKKV